MKMAAMIGTLAGLLVFVGMGGRCAYAQFEVNPDHFESPNTEPFGKTNASGKVPTTHTRVANHCTQCTTKTLARESGPKSAHARRRLSDATLIQKGPGGASPTSDRSQPTIICSQA